MWSTRTSEICTSENELGCYILPNSESNGILSIET